MINIDQHIPLDKLVKWNEEHQIGLKIETVHKGEKILKEGYKCNYMYLVVKGFLRMYYYGLDGREMTHWFATEGSVCTSPFSFFKDEPNPQNIEVLEDSELILITRTQLEQVVQLLETQNRQKPVRNAFIDISMIMSRRIISMNTETAEQQYLRFKEEHPEIFKRAKLAHIASYIGVRPQSLSRIRKSLEK